MNISDYAAGVSRGFDLSEKNGMAFYKSPLLEKTGLVKHCFTTRIGGVSPPPFDSLNFSKKREKNKENILKNYQIVADAFGLDTGSFSVDNYAHGYQVAYVEKSAGGLVEESSLPLCDGLSTEKKGQTLVTLHADCLALFFLDVKTPAIALCHAGWKGIYTHIAVKTVDFMRERYGTAVRDILAAVGPSIGPCCFEVQGNVAGLFEREFGDGTVEKREGRLYVDLWKACLSEFMSCGIPAGNVNLSELCTSCGREHFFSHRRDRGKTGAMMAFMQLI